MENKTVLPQKTYNLINNLVKFIDEQDKKVQNKNNQKNLIEEEQSHDNLK